MKILKKESLNTGDIVGIPQKVSIGWGSFRYERIIPMKIKRMTPARTKIIMENGIECSRYHTFYELDEEAKHRTYVAECADSLNSNIFKLTELKRNGELFNKSDEIIVTVSDLLSQIIEVCNNE